MNKINLSYVIATKNKVHFLKEVLKRIIAVRQVDEEIIVVDGFSTDGTSQYLKKLYDEGKIQQFISEKDVGESHATNKGFLLAQGILIKVITDDDAFYYPNIQKMKEYMLEHPDVDMMGAEGTATYMDGSIGEISNNWKEYAMWKKNKRAFSFCGLGLLIRKKSLAITGLFDTSSVRADMEFTFRASSKIINMAWFAGPTFIRLLNPSSNSFKKYLRVNLEGIALEHMYLHTINFYLIPILYLKSIILRLFQSAIKNKFNVNINDLFLIADKKLAELNHSSHSVFID